MPYSLTRKAEVDGVGAEGSPIRDDDPGLPYYLAHGYVEREPEVADGAMAKPTRDAVVRRRKS